MSKPKIPPNMINTSFLTYPKGWSGWVPSPHVAQFSWLPHVLGTPAYISKYAPTPPEWMPSIPFLSHRGMSCTESLPCSLRNKFFAILYKIIGKLPLSTCFTNLIVGTPCFVHWQCFIISHRSVNFQKFS